MVRTPPSIFMLIILLGITSPATACWAATTPPLGNQDSPERRFALLVGIDDYQQPTDPQYHVNPLKGPANDVKMMKSLLIARGFPDDGAHIFTLTSSQATHDGILSAIQQRLIGNAKIYPGSTVLFYFSGHGSQSFDTSNTTGTGAHQTLVAYDSRADDGKGDILDDELNARLEQLRKFTENIVMIFDSCHSGTVWRDVTTQVSKSLPPNPMRSSIKRMNDIEAKDVIGTIKPTTGDYSIIVAATADETALEDLMPSIDGSSEYHGLLTYFLDRALRHSPRLTYDQLAKEVARKVATRAPSQHPEAEGDINRFFLGSAGDSEQPYVPLTKILSEKRILLRTGLVDGTQIGALVAVYDKGVKEAAGDKGRLANAHVVAVDALSAVAELAEKPARPLTTADKATIITPYPPGQGIPVYLPTLSTYPVPETSAADAFLDRLRQKLKQNKLLAVTDDLQRADILVRWECENAVEDKQINNDIRAQPLNQTCRSGYRFYISPLDRPMRIFDFAETETGSADDLANAIGKRAKQDILRELTNEASGVKNAIQMELETLDVEENNGLPSIKTKGISNSTETPIHIGNHFRFKITNQSDQTFYVSVIYLASGGGIGLYSPSNTGDPVLPGRTLVTRPPLTAGPPFGIETYVVIATTKQGIDFRVLQQPGRSKSAAHSPFEWLLSQSVDQTARDSTPEASLDVGDWTTTHQDIFIIK
jgi:hypothetical protein